MTNILWVLGLVCFFQETLYKGKRGKILCAYDKF